MPLYSSLSTVFHLGPWVTRVREETEIDRSPGNDYTMNYAKPEVVVLGDAACIIVQTRWKAGLVFDQFTGTHTIAPAYDLDD